MRYNVAQLLKEPTGATRRYPLEETFPGEPRIADQVQGPVQLLRTHQGVLVTAQLAVRTTFTCSRCLAESNRLSRITLEEEFFPRVDVHTGKSLPTPPGAVAPWLIDARHVLDLTEAVRQYVITDLPMKPLCREECGGLCQWCGANRNRGACHCAPGQPEPPRGALAALLGPAGS